MPQPNLQSYFEQNKDDFLKKLFEFLSYPSISQSQESMPAMQQCLQFLQSFLNNLGFETETWQTSTYPTLFAQWMKAGPKAPTVLLYNHYDVQPVDPIEKWHHSPFEPHIVHDQIYARGAQDNKGQCFYVLLALKALIDLHGKLPVNVKVCIEGDEEIGSGGLRGIVQMKSKELKADYLIITDLGIKSLKEPAITLGTRGMLGMLIDLKGPSMDLHSGEHGGIIINPLHAMISLLSKLHAPSGQVMVPGFYEHVEELSEQEKEIIDFSFDESAYEHTFHAKPVGGEENYLPLERAWIRPTVELNGLSSGYTGDGLKTIIPSSAHAKLTCRLVPHQDPDRIAILLTEFLNENKPKGMHLHIETRHGSPAVRTSPHSKIAQAALKAYSEVFSIPCKMILAGGSIGVAESLVKASGAEIIFLGLGLPDDQIHSPNEHFSVQRLCMGMEIIAKILQYVKDE